jgi:hypothetical protein
MEGERTMTVTACGLNRGVGGRAKRAFHVPNHDMPCSAVVLPQRAALHRPNDRAHRGALPLPISHHEEEEGGGKRNELL